MTLSEIRRRVRRPQAPVRPRTSPSSRPAAPPKPSPTTGTVPNRPNPSASSGVSPTPASAPTPSPTSTIISTRAVAKQEIPNPSRNGPQDVPLGLGPPLRQLLRLRPPAGSRHPPGHPQLVPLTQRPCPPLGLSYIGADKSKALPAARAIAYGQNDRRNSRCSTNRRSRENGEPSQFDPPPAAVYTSFPRKREPRGTDCQCLVAKIGQIAPPDSCFCRRDDLGTPHTIARRAAFSVDTPARPMLA